MYTLKSQVGCQAAFASRLAPTVDLGISTRDRSAVRQPSSERRPEQARSHNLPALLTSTLFVVCADWHGLQRRFNQAESNTEVVEPVLNFLFHGAPFR
ncbi:hypothetical protein PS723_02996 [Pseudomonas fluorescens]|uniref:Uncharacterized protein n=1 Tax=Pseudomonas fluorescens TaxID=294 RepID=A0A5E7CKR8_PSEFL|nr:hypothetical protein PS723_02996 [Pseudomonas fluorescens]